MLQRGRVTVSDVPRVSKQPASRRSTLSNRVERLFPAGVAMASIDARRFRSDERNGVIWLLVLILAIVAIGGGIALSKFLFLVLVAAVLLAVVGGRSGSRAA